MFSYESVVHNVIEKYNRDFQSSDIIFMKDFSVEVPGVFMSSIYENTQVSESHQEEGSPSAGNSSPFEANYGLDDFLTGVIQSVYGETPDDAERSSSLGMSILCFRIFGFLCALSIAKPF
ncbi:hypothetical protein D915_006410 [Fasciola hepatica]|uniref:Uncharacterized protein n=1 Tax=Fasciola hepatica TaxID=6192 RepID=A0A4E0R8E2_FASHE|nr:hypothetical protein D915_006410 [Fasciola hepatica]